MLQSLCGNPTKLLSCINENWYEIKVKQQEKKMTTKDIIKVMQAYVDGKTIQIRLSVSDDKWEDSKAIEPNWNWYQYDYRIKPEPKYRPLKPEELIELKDKWLKAKNNSTVSLITDLVEFSGVVIKGTYRSLNELFNYWTYEDGTPVGKLEE
jgi:hypothetical protein